MEQITETNLNFIDRAATESEKMHWGSVSVPTRLIRIVVNELRELRRLRDLAAVVNQHKDYK